MQEFLSQCLMFTLCSGGNEDPRHHREAVENRTRCAWDAFKRPLPSLGAHGGAFGRAFKTEGVTDNPTILSLVSQFVTRALVSVSEV